ncbi:MAG: Gfo/Idh/MocA family protein [Fimbriiglobus sp.]
MKPVKFALIGTGGIAQSYAQAFEANDHAQLVAVCDVRPEAAKAMAERFRCPAFTNPTDMVSQTAGLEAVVICTPPNTHEELTMLFVKQGLHVLCEKPFTLTPSSARRMTEAAKQAGVLLTMASKFRYVEDVIKAKSLMSSGILGDIILFENAFTSRVDMTNRWNSNPDIAGGGVLIDNGTHSVDLMRYFLGPLSDVTCVEGKRPQGLVVEDTARIFVRSTSGVMGSVDLSWSINKELDWYLNIYGSQGTVSVGWKESKYKSLNAKEWIVFGKGYNKLQAFHSEITNFANAIRGTEQLLITAEDAIASVEVIEAAYTSLRESHWSNVGRIGDLARTPAPKPRSQTSEKEAAHAG